MYKIHNWFPSKPSTGSGHNFTIILTPRWKELVSKSLLNQEKIDEIVAVIGPHILAYNDIDVSKIDNINYWIRIDWGEWGPEHITIPGNACGLDIDLSLPGIDGEVSLTPHNIDTLNQASMILTLFLQIANHLESEEWLRNHSTF